jgi:hypothetical protein
LAVGLPAQIQRPKRCPPAFDNLGDLSIDFKAPGINDVAQSCHFVISLQSVSKTVILCREAFPPPGGFRVFPVAFPGFERRLKQHLETDTPLDVHALRDRGASPAQCGSDDLAIDPCRIEKAQNLTLDLLHRSVCDAVVDVANVETPPDQRLEPRPQLLYHGLALRMID